MITPEQLKILYDKCKIEKYIDIGRLVTYINIHFQTQQENKDKLLELYRQVAGVNLSRTMMPEVWYKITQLEIQDKIYELK